MSNNEFNFTHMKILNKRSHYKVNLSNDKADINDKIYKFYPQINILRNVLLVKICILCGQIACL